MLLVCLLFGFTLQDVSLRRLEVLSVLFTAIFPVVAAVRTMSAVQNSLENYFNG
jgi:hypothetical protein